MKNKGKNYIKLALFDIDGTIFRSSLLIELINELVSQGVFPATAKKEMEKEYVAWLDRKGTYDAYIVKVINIHLKYVKGKDYGKVKGIAQQVIHKMKDRVYRYTRGLIADLKRKNFYLVAISGSPTYIVSEFSRHWGFQNYFGSVYEIKNGSFTGKALNSDSYANKVKLVNTLIQSLGQEVDMRNSLAIGDTQNDVSMLEMFGRPIAMNPNSGLAKIAKKRGWEIVVERKDVIYRVNDFKFLNRA